jgi:hypothetical protein
MRLWRWVKSRWSNPERDAQVPRVVVTQASGADAVAQPGIVRRPTLAKLLAGHILRDGEVILLVLRPSLWFILTSSLRFVAGVLILAMGARIFVEAVQRNPWVVVQVAGAIIIGRLLWGVLQWSGKLYVLTDARVLALDGVIHVDVFDCPLRKIARARVIANTRERILWLGSIEIIPQDEDLPIGLWQTVARPRWVLKMILEQISRSRHGTFRIGAA